jgi:hypothetical protein
MGNFVLFIALMVLPLLALIDARRASNAQWEAIGQKRMIWMVGIVLGALVSPLAGVVIGGLYLWRIKPRLAAAQQAL